MITNESRWEAGSEFHWPQLPSVLAEPALPGSASLYSCGRTALAALLQFGMKELGWRRLWIPTYNCPDVVNTILSIGIQALTYSDNPCETAQMPENIKTGDVIFLVNFFGMNDEAEYAGFFQAGVPIIEDHSHDPWSTWAMGSKADYIIASLRKTLPIPGGGALWSNIGAPMPSAPAAECHTSQVIAPKLQAMLLKSIYLSGGLTSKPEYLRLYEKAIMEFNLATTLPNLQIEDMSPISKYLLSIFPWRHWREIRLANSTYFHENVRLRSDIRFIGNKKPGMYPFSQVLLFAEPDQRTRVQDRLIARSLYPAILWPINKTDCPWADEKAVNISERMLSIHCDGRYGQDDMEKIVNIFSECVLS